MNTAHSRYKSHDVTHAGVYAIWTSMGHTANGGAIPAPASLRSAAAGGNSRTGGGQDGDSTAAVAEREPIRQGSAAWAALKQSQQANDPATARSNNRHQHASGLTPSGHIASSNSAQHGRTTAAAGPSRLRSHPYRKYLALPAPQPDADFAAALEAINGSRDISHPGAIGAQKLPPGDRPAARRMILALCGRGRVPLNAYGEDHEDDEGLEQDGGDIQDPYERTRAAAWAWFEGDSDRAVRTLLDSTGERSCAHMTSVLQA